MPEEGDCSRRRWIRVCGGIGTVGISGCLRLQDNSEATPTESPDSTESTSVDEPENSDVREGGTQTDTTPQDESEEGDSTSQGGSDEVTLSESWTDEDGADHIRTNQGKFYYNESDYAANALSGRGVRWSVDVSYNGVEKTGGEAALAIEGQYRIFGYSPSDPDKGAHFHAFDRSGEEVWASGAPSDGKHNFAIGATVAGDIAVFGARQKGGELDGDQEPLVWGVDTETGETVWETGRPTHGFASLGYVGSHDGKIYIGWGGGTKVLDGEDGSVIEAHDSWSISYAPWGGSTGQIHGETLFAYQPSFAPQSGVHAYPVGANGLSWSYSDSELGRPDAPPAVDNSLVVVATDEGEIRALERSSGEERWNTSITGAVRSIETSGTHVWVADRGTGLTAYDRETGQLVHRSTKSIQRSDIAVASDVLLIGGETATAYTIDK